MSYRLDTDARHRRVTITEPKRRHAAHYGVSWIVPIFVATVNESMPAVLAADRQASVRVTSGS
jgi:hypothetical protein